MAKYNEILVGRFNNAMKKFLGMKGPAPSPQMAGEIGATIPLFFGAEARFLEEWSRFAVTPQAPATAAQNSVVTLRNPAGSNVVAVVEKLGMFFNPTGGVEIRNGITVDATTADVNRSLDKRGRPSATLISAHANNFATAGNIFAVVQTPALTLLDYIVTDIQEITLLPGDGLMVDTPVNTLLQVNFIWRERFLEDSERQ